MTASGHLGRGEAKIEIDVHSRSCAHGGPAKKVEQASDVGYEWQPPKVAQNLIGATSPVKHKLAFGYAKRPAMAEGPIAMPNKEFPLKMRIPDGDTQLIYQHGTKFEMAKAGCVCMVTRKKSKSKQS